ncbi:hypothetical protein BXZ70DRAFT_916769 [Cristinia sonorae]|uniref:Uncharacterized protein n=1 Tax=Cristinia sonorae TaxID=1940300 RepID=A0A8K0UYU0_9AGAR|nr:hypothetical protein BXZ70DRAFT_916769 [Cristinia sonorae]
MSLNMLFNLRKKRQPETEVSQSSLGLLEVSGLKYRKAESQTSSRPWKGVKQRAMRRLAAHAGRRGTPVLPKSSSDPSLASEYQDDSPVRRIRKNRDDCLLHKRPRHASWPNFYPQGTEELPVSSNDISKLFRRNTLDSISSGGHEYDCSGDSTELVLNIRHVDNQPAHFAEVTSPASSPSGSAVSAEGVIPDVLLTPSILLAPPPTPWETEDQMQIKHLELGSVL